MRLKTPLSLIVTLIVLASSPQSVAEQGADGWPTGVVYAINYKERQLVIDQEKYRIALKARVSEQDGSALPLEALQPQFYVKYQREFGDEGDIIDVVILARP